MLASVPSFPSAAWAALGTTVAVLTNDHKELAVAEEVVRRYLGEVDRTCSRFRDDSELTRVSSARGLPTHISPLFMRAAKCALRAARLTDGDLDPTIGTSI